MSAAQKVDVLAGILLAARDCTAQGNQQAANELLDVKTGVSELLTSCKILLNELSARESKPESAGGFNYYELLAIRNLRSALARIGGDRS